MTLQHLPLPIAQKQLDDTDVDDFDALLNALDLGVITRRGWDRLKALLVEAMIGAADAEKGLKGYLCILPKWEKSAAYDGRP